MTTCYPVILHKDTDGYIVDIPDFNSGTQGETLYEALKMAEDAVSLLAVTYEDKGLSLPQPSRAQDLILESSEDFINYVPIDTDWYRYKLGINNEEVSTNITIPENLKSQFNPKTGEEVFWQNVMLLYPYIKTRSFSYDRAGKILGLSKTDVIEIYAKLGIPYCDYYPEEELDKELEMMRKDKVGEEK